MRRSFLLLLFVIAIVGCLYLLPGRSPERWAVYYADTLPVSAFRPFNVIVFDSNDHPPLAPLKAQHKILLGYLSLGEAEDYRPYYKEIESNGMLLQANPAWKGHRVIDIRNPAWAPYVINKLIPFILAQGFDGIMIDTMDSPIQLEDDHPKQYTGMKQAAIALIKAIRTHFPHIRIMLNRGFDILPQVTSAIDMEMAESTYSTWSPGQKPMLVSVTERKECVDLLHAVQQQSPLLKIYTIDYWPLEDQPGVKRIYAAQRAKGFVPYVATPDLQSLQKEPQ